MLIFFIHGVATRDVKYAQKLQKSIRQEFLERRQPLPHFCSGFWGNIQNNLGKVWNWVDEDLLLLKSKRSEIEVDNAFRYQAARKGFLSEFVGDAFTYLSSERGAKIRELLATQLEDFITLHPQESEIHLIAHSLGTVILWDVLFSERLDRDRATLKIRSMLRELSRSDCRRTVSLRSITTMGSPILLFNLMMEISPERVQQFTSSFESPLQWLNIIHASDIIAYPICSSLGQHSLWNLQMRDEFTQTDANGVEKFLRSLTTLPFFNSLNEIQREAVSNAPMLAGAADAHLSYFSCPRTTKLILENISFSPPTCSDDTLKKVKERLLQVPGFTKPMLNLDQPRTEMVSELSFRDGSGCLKLYRNLINVHHVQVYDQDGICQFGGYVGWIHTGGLRATIETIEQAFC